MFVKGAGNIHTFLYRYCGFISISVTVAILEKMPMELYVHVYMPSYLHICVVTEVEKWYRL